MGEIDDDCRAASAGPGAEFRALRHLLSKERQTVTNAVFHAHTPHVALRPHHRARITVAIRGCIRDRRRRVREALLPDAHVARHFRNDRPLRLLRDVGSEACRFEHQVFAQLNVSATLAA